MTAEEAKRHQDQLAAEGWTLGFWYGTRCGKCCGVYPKLVTGIGGFADRSRYECEVCGKRTGDYDMPWQAEAAWEKGQYALAQGRLF